jgi:hypothetical protein
MPNGYWFIKDVFPTLKIKIKTKNQNSIHIHDSSIIITTPSSNNLIYK